MKTMLKLNELRLLDLILKDVAYYSKQSFKPQLLIKEDQHLFSGDFFIYDGALACYTEKSMRFTYRKQSLDVEYDTVLDELLPALYTNAEAAFAAHIQNLDAFAELLLSENFLNGLQNKLHLNSEKLSPYIYKPVFYTANTPDLEFYILDPKKEYEVVSIICQPVQTSIPLADK